MLKKMVLCGAVALLLIGAVSVSDMKAQSFVLDPNNTTSNNSRDVKPAYKGGVVVPYNPDNGGQYGHYNQTQRTRSPQQQQTGPISYGVVRDSGRTGNIYNGYGVNQPEQERTGRTRAPDHEARYQALKERQKARDAERTKKMQERAAAQKEAMLRAKEEYEARNGGSENKGRR